MTKQNSKTECILHALRWESVYLMKYKMRVILFVALCVVSISTIFILKFIFGGEVTQIASVRWSPDNKSAIIMVTTIDKSKSPLSSSCSARVYSTDNYSEKITIPSTCMSPLSTISKYFISRSGNELYFAVNIDGVARIGTFSLDQDHDIKTVYKGNEGEYVFHVDEAPDGCISYIGNHNKWNWLSKDGGTSESLIIASTLNNISATPLFVNVSHLSCYNDRHGYYLSRTNDGKLDIIRVHFTNDQLESNLFSTISAPADPLYEISSDYLLYATAMPSDPARSQIECSGKVVVDNLIDFSFVRFDTHSAIWMESGSHIAHKATSLGEMHNYPVSIPRGITRIFGYNEALNQFLAQDNDTIYIVELDKGTIGTLKMEAI